MVCIVSGIIVIIMAIGTYINVYYSPLLKQYLKKQIQNQEKCLHKSRLVRKHLTRGFLCAVLDLSGTLWPLLIPEYSGIKRRGTPFPGLRNPGISHYSDKYPLSSYEMVIVCNSLFNRDRLLFCKSGILIFIFAEINHLIRQYICPCHVD